MTDATMTRPAARPRLMERYRAFLPVTDATPDLTLGEGFTPLVHATHLGDALGLRRLFLKVEGQNPTGSFKDRGMVVAVAKAVEEGATTVICASTGNTAASAAAYAARAGLKCVVLLPSGKVALGKVAQAVVYGARVVIVDTNFDGSLDLARQLSAEHGAALVNSVNPHRIEGQATSSYEICDAFWEKNSIYGFGDLQVLQMLKEMKIEFSDDPDENLMN